MFPIMSLIPLAEKIFDRVLPDQEKAAEAKAKLMELAQSGQLKEIELAMQDLASARDREVKIATSADAPYLNKIVTPLLALGTVGLSFLMFAILVFIQVEPAAKDILIYVLGALTSAMTIVLGYYFGSSQGSKDKSDEIQRLLK